MTAGGRGEGGRAAAKTPTHKRTLVRLRHGMREVLERLDVEDAALHVSRVTEGTARSLRSPVCGTGLRC